MNIGGAFAVTCRHKQGSENLCCWCTQPLIWGWTIWLCLLVEALVLCPLGDLFSTIFCLHLCTFCWWLCCLKWPPGVMLKCCQVFLSTENRDAPYGENMCARYTSFTQVMVLLAMKSMLMNQQYVLNKVSSNRNIYKTRLCTDQRLVGNDPLFPPGGILEYSLIRYSQHLCRK